MGTFMGHVLPGSFFIVIALMDILHTSIGYFKTLQRPPTYFQPNTYYTVSLCGRKLPLASFLKLFITSFGIVVEILTGFDANYVFAHYGNFHHTAMYAFFGTCGLLEILHYYSFNLPPNILYVAYVLSFAVEGILFYWHLHNRLMLDIQVHMLLICVIAATLIALVAELQRGSRTSVLPTICRLYLVLLQGFWFWQIAFILYPPAGFAQWSEDNHNHMMLATIIFALDAGLAALVVLAIWFAVACRFGQCRRQTQHDEDEYGLLTPDRLELQQSNGHIANVAFKPDLHSLSEEDDDFLHDANCPLMS